ncbi:MAG: PepSY-associated TM helix domain-containing protein [Acidobacteria bacterium]|nr:PepSY-associated TM helix domain-containing protein [Acidobacteriota bacterium]
MKLRRLIIATHRDVGYFFAGLTVLYAISGVAVNHVDDWNPSYVIRQGVAEVGVLPFAEAPELGTEVLRRMGIAEEPRSVVRMSAEELKIFLERRTLTVGLPGGRVIDERVRRRFAFFEVNFLHLNTGKGFWTWFADLYAVGLLILACTGIFIIPGKKGLGGRGRWLLLAGLAIPLVYLVLVVWR